MAGIIISLIKLFSLLPLSLLFLFSDLLSFLLRKVLGYRKEVIRNNLSRSFPKRSDAELLKIEAQFYRFFSDMIFETLKNFSLPTSKVGKHVKVRNPELMNAYARDGKHVLIVTGHYGNWEFNMSILNALIEHEVKVLYKPFKSDLFHKIMAFERSRHGIEIIPMKSALRAMMGFKKASATVFIADQSPSYVETLWTTFLNQETPIFEGPERISTKLKMPVVYLRVFRTGRGKYELEFEEICTDASQTNKNEISLKHTKLLERDIENEAYPWLWSHKRWKRKRPGGIQIIE